LVKQEKGVEEEVMHTRYFFNKKLEELHLDLIKMGSLVEESIEKTILALKKQDIKLAERIVKNDDLIDDLEQKIEEKCLIIIARQQPLAKDLRAIGAALKMITDMERIADHSADIAEITMRMVNEHYIKPLIDIPQMAELAKGMVNKSIDAYVKQDIEIAKAVCDYDDEVDNLFEQIVLELMEIMKKEPQTVEQATNLLFIAKYLERMADHATNISEWVIFNVTGEHIRCDRG